MPLLDEGICDADEPRLGASGAGGVLPAIGIILLAAGGSRRLGTPKQLLRFQGRSLLRHSVEAALASLAHPVVVVLGAYAERLKPEISDLPVQVVENQRWAEGMSSSLRAGMQALTTVADTLEAVLLMVCDQPYVASRTLNGIIEAYRSTGRPIVASEYAGTVGVPALFTRDLFPDLMTLEGDHGASHIIRTHEDEVLRFPFPEAGIDIDTREDYEALRTIIEKGRT